LAALTKNVSHSKNMILHLGKSALEQTTPLP